MIRVLRHGTSNISSQLQVRQSKSGAIQEDGCGSCHTGGHRNKRGRRVHVDGELRGVPGVLVRLLGRLQLPLRVRSRAPQSRAAAPAPDVHARAASALCRSSECLRNPARRAHARRRYLEGNLDLNPKP